jgi:signal transduction histidine kinase
VTNATELLHDDGAPEPERAQVLGILQRSVTSLYTLLDDLISLSRLEAGQERRRIETFDAVLLLREFCETLRPVAIERGLFLVCEGPSELLVQGDAVKIQRITQNLLLNALRYTTRGGVKVTWQETGDEGMERWTLCVEDTGPGLQAESVAPLSRVLKRATEESLSMEAKAEEAGDPSAQAEPAPTLASQSQRRPAGLPAGEGIGLSIVKRLCELLDASLELETEAGRGSTFRVVFPRRYDGPAAG